MFREQVLGQFNASNVTAVAVYTATSGAISIVKQIKCVNTNASTDADMTLYYNGSTNVYNSNTQIEGPVTLLANGGSYEWDGFIPYNNLDGTAPGTFGYKSSVSSALNITLWGAKVTNIS